MAGFNNPTGFGNSPTGFGPKPMPGQAPGAASPAVESLKQALAAKQAGSRADMLEKRANIISPGNSSLLTGPMDAWLAQNEREKQTAATVASQTAEEAEAEAKRKQQAVAAGQLALASGQTQEMADAVAMAVMSGMDMPDIPQPEPHAGFDVRDKIYDDSKDALKGIYKTQTSMEVLNQMVDKGYDSGVAQIGAMYSFIKGIDPDSVVRPSETDLVGLAESYIQQMQNIVTRVETGVVSSEAVFNDLVELTGKLNEVQISGARRAMDDHIGRANVEGYEAEQVWGQPFAERYSMGPTQASTPPATAGAAKAAPAGVDDKTAEQIIADAQAVLEAKG